MLKRALKLILCTICILSVLKSAKEFRDAESALEAQMNLSERDEAASDRIAVLNAARKVMEGGAEEDIDTVVADYFALIRAGYKGEKPKHVELSPDDAYLIQIDGQAYDLHMLIRHDDEENTERKMEIEVLRNGRFNEFLDETEARLNQMIQNECKTREGLSG